MLLLSAPKRVYFQPHLMKKPSESREPQEHGELFTSLPEKAVVSENLRTRVQQILFDKSKFDSHKEWIRLFSEKPDQEKLQKAISFTISNLSGQNHKVWDELVSSGNLYDMVDCMEHKVCTCFHRSIFLNFLLSQVDIRSGIVGGRVIESTKDISFPFPPHLAARMGKFALGFHEEDFDDGHGWNIVELDGRLFLVDSSFLVDGKTLIEPITFEGSYPCTFKIDVGNGKHRYYLLESKVDLRELT